MPPIAPESDRKTAYIAALVSGGAGAFVQLSTTLLVHWTSETPVLQAAAYAIAPALIIFFFGLVAAHFLMRRTPVHSAIAHDVPTAAHHADDPNRPSTIDVQSESSKLAQFYETLEQLGLSHVTSHLSDSPFTPHACMSNATQSLSFLGILGSKWVIEPHVRSEFKLFLSKVRTRNGFVRFCLINPSSRAFSQLHDLRGGQISTESLKHFTDLETQFENLEVRLYSFLPSLRLILLDRRQCVIARYLIDQHGYFQSKYGWEAPHIAFSADAPWSLYVPFEHYFDAAWESAAPLRDSAEELDHG
jgi:hypothetical protein